MSNATGPTFFLYLAYTLPHAELIVPDDSMLPYRGKFPEEPWEGRHYGHQSMPHAAYAGMVSRLDRDVGILLELLKDLGIEQNTLVMFSSDNGPTMAGGGDPEFFDSNGPLRGLKRDLYEGGIRVPLIARWPGVIGQGTTTDHPSAFWDLLPTFTELAHLDAPRGIDGHSLVPTLLGKPATQAKHEFMYWEFHRDTTTQAVRMGPWKGIRHSPDGALELYNLKSDIGEENDLAAKNPDIVRKIEDYMSTARIPSKYWSMRNETIWVKLRRSARSMRRWLGKLIGY